jgi:hypothetical protein
VAPDQDVVKHGEIPEHLDVLEGPHDAFLDDLLRSSAN